MHKLAIHSVPRSGSTWLGNIFNSHPSMSFKYQPLFSYAFKDYLKTDSSTNTINSFFNEINLSDDHFINQNEGIEKGIIPLFEKDKDLTHICYKEVRYHNLLENMLRKDNEIKFILLIRNPLAVLQSWRMSPAEFRIDKGWVFTEEWLDAPKKNLNRQEEFYGFNKWKEVAILFHKLVLEYPERIRLIRYADLLKNTFNTIEQLFDFANLSIPSQTKEFINNSKMTHHNNEYSVYKKKIDDKNWMDLPKDVIEFVRNDLNNSDLEQYINE